MWYRVSRTERQRDTAVRLESTDAVPADGRVRHYDELPEGAQGALPALTSGVPGEAILDESTARTFVDGEYVKFTDYYRVSVET